MMQRRSFGNPRLARSAALGAIMGAFLLFMGLSATQLAHADARSRCQHRIEHAQARLDHEIQRHGAHSPQADAAWHDLRAEREQCWHAYHQWWDARDHSWHHDNNWDQDPRGPGNPPGPGL
jgi:hypothetical protein